MNIKWEYDQWSKAVREFMKLTSRSLQGVINQELKYISINSYKHTRKADRKDLETRFFSGATVSRRRRIKNPDGKHKYETVEIYDSYAKPSPLLYAKLFKKKPEMKALLSNSSMSYAKRQKEITKAAIKLGKTILSHCGYTRMGWLWAKRGFGGGGQDFKFQVYSKYGDYKKAKKEEKIKFAFIENSAVLAPIYALPAMKLAFSLQTQYIKNEIKRRLQNNADKFKPK